VSDISKHDLSGELLNITVSGTFKQNDRAAIGHEVRVFGDHRRDSAVVIGKGGKVS